MPFRSFSLRLFAVLAFLAFDAFGDEESRPKPPPRPEAKLVTLASPKLSLRQALTEMTQQTGIPVEDARGLPDHPLQLALNKTPFWQAVDALAAAENARVSLFPTSGRIVLDKRGPHYRLPPIGYDGRFRFAVKKVATSRDLEVRDEASSRGATFVSLEIAWDTELQPLYLETWPHAVRLVDDKNHVHVLPDEGSSLAPVDGRIAATLDLRLPLLPRSIAKISSLEGRLSMIGPSKMLTFAFERLDKLAKANARDPERGLTREGVACRLREVKLAADRWTIQVELRYPPGMKQLDSNQSWVVNNEMRLESLDGKQRFASTDYAVMASAPGHAVLSYHFRDKGGLKRGQPRDWKLTYRAPADLIEVPIQFNFKDIPLP